MDKKIIIGSFLAIAILGIVVGLVFNTRINPLTQSEDTVSSTSPQPSPQEAWTTTIKEAPKLPTLTIAPYFSKIQSIDDQFIHISGKEGTARFTKSKIKVFRRSGDQLVPADLTDLKVGQSITLKPVVPGKETHLIIE